MSPTGLWPGGRLALDRQTGAVLVSLALAECLVSVVTWYGVSILGGREMNVVYGYSPSIEVGRPVLALMFAILLLLLLDGSPYRLVGVGTLTGLGVGDLSYDITYIVVRSPLVAVGVGLAVGALIPLGCAAVTHRKTMKVPSGGPSS
jgi:hypothetical protein